MLFSFGAAHANVITMARIPPTVNSAVGMYRAFKQVVELSEWPALHRGATVIAVPSAYVDFLSGGGFPLS